MSIKNSMLIQVNHGIVGHKGGDVVEVATLPGTEVPRELHWRRRLKDSAQDNCCSILPAKPAAKAKTGKKSASSGGES